jgi:monooxygenase
MTTFELPSRIDIPRASGGPGKLDHFDVLIVGAGISGIGAAYHLQQRCPGKSFAILEGREAIGGTWDLFRYPGVRSDSDMHTLGYRFKPWKAEKSIADGAAIREYLEETVRENRIEKHIRFGHSVKAASWSSEDARWTVEAERTDGSGTSRVSCAFLFICSGYYNYERGHTPEFEGIERFAGPIIHPQFWPKELDYTDKRVVVIGSGATAVTLVPAMAADAAHVTMLQRSPTYVVSAPEKDAIANRLRRLLPEKLAYSLTRFKNVHLQQFAYNQTRVRPEWVKKRLLARVRKQLGPDYDVDTHFTPSYNPWDERLCLVPNGDLFETIKSGDASVVTDRIDHFTESGIMLESGQELEADVIVTATGLELIVMGGARFEVDGKPIDFHDTYSYKGMMYSGVPNLVQTFGYVNASWTLRADLTSEYVCRLLNRMDEIGMQQCGAELREEDQGMETRPWIDGFTPNYMKRVMHLFPKQGDKVPWRNTQDYSLDKKTIRKAPLEDGALVFSHPISG